MKNPEIDFNNFIINNFNFLNHSKNNRLLNGFEYKEIPYVKKRLQETRLSN